MLGIGLVVAGLAITGDPTVAPDAVDPALAAPVAALRDADLGAVVTGASSDLGVAGTADPIGVIETISGITVVVYDDAAQAAHARLAVAALGLPGTPDRPDAVGAPGERFVLGAGDRLIVFRHDDLPYLANVVVALQAAGP